MDCSNNFSTFANDFYDPWYYIFDNETILYCNGSYPMNWICNATIEADSDIAGLGIISSFLLVAWITILVATVPAFYDFLEFLSDAREFDWHLRKAIQRKTSTPTNHLRRTAQLRRMLNLDRMAWLRTTATDLLNSLCDLQIVTGLAIVIAGLAQIRTITFYHESMAMNYWWLTLNSFWAARVEYMEDNNIKYKGRATVRKIGVLVSVVLGIAFQCIVNVRESREWFFLLPGHCYLTHDHSSTWPWVVGASVYAVALFLTLVPVTRPWVEEYLMAVRNAQSKLVDQWKNSFSALQSDTFQSIPGANRSSMRAILLVTFRIAHFTALSFFVVLYWLFLQFLSAWSYGDGFYPLLILVYIGFAAWQTFDILDLKLSNRSLVSGKETSWGFGQVLPMVLLLTVMYNAIDAFESSNN